MSLDARKQDNLDYVIAVDFKDGDTQKQG